VNRRYPRWNARRSSATSGYFAASASTSPISGWPAIQEGCREAAGRNSLVADKCDAHETARGVGLELEQRANLFGTQIIGHSSLKIERRTSNVQYRIGSWTSNLKFQIVKIEQA
jgi:hypothetical protein